MTVTVLHARTEAECASVRRLVEAHARYERSTVLIPEGWTDRVLGHVAAGTIDLFVALEDTVTIGYASLTHEISTWTGEVYGHLDCLYLYEDHRGRGAGQLLLAAVADHAHRLGYRQLKWQTPNWNHAATRFYHRNGARNVPKERFTLPLINDGR